MKNLITKFPLFTLAIFILGIFLLIPAFAQPLSTPPGGAVNAVFNSVTAGSGNFSGDITANNGGFLADISAVIANFANVIATDGIIGELTIQADGDISDSGGPVNLDDNEGFISTITNVTSINKAAIVGVNNDPTASLATGVSGQADGAQGTGGKFSGGLQGIYASYDLPGGTAGRFVNHLGELTAIGGDTYSMLAESPIDAQGGILNSYDDLYVKDNLTVEGKIKATNGIGNFITVSLDTPSVPAGSTGSVAVYCPSTPGGPALSIPNYKIVSCGFDNNDSESYSYFMDVKLSLSTGTEYCLIKFKNNDNVSHTYNGSARCFNSNG